MPIEVPSTPHWAAILLGARTLEERLLAPDPAPAPAPEAVARVADAWARAFAAGDREALSRRLLWDGIEPARALARVAAAPAPGPPGRPDWFERLERLDLVGRDLRAAEARPELAGVPFAELWRPWTAAALGPLRSARRDGVGVPEGAFAGLAEGLGRDLARISERAAYEAYTAVREGRPGDYAAFVERQLEAGLMPLYEAYPLLLRQTLALVGGFQDALLELLERWVADRAVLERACGGPRGRWVGLQRLPSDRHAGGRQVFRLVFDSGPGLVYKPRGVEPEALFERLAGWLASADLADPPPAARVLARDGYGWMEEVAPSEPAPGAETRRWYRRAGALIALADLLGAEDLHAENLICTREGPVAVDLEMILAPARAATDLERGGALGSGLLGARRPGADRIGRWAGLEPVEPGAGIGLERAWEGVGGDELRPVAKPPAPPALANVPRPGGRALRAGAFAPELAAGYQSAYRRLLAGRPELLGAQGPLGGRARVRTRVLFRASQDYASILDRLTGPRCQRDGLAAGFLLEATLRVFAGSAERPLLWPLAAAERRALQDLDIPRFDLPADGTALPLPGGGRIEAVFPASGLERARARFACWSESDLAVQSEALAGALVEPPGPSGLALAWRSAGDGGGGRWLAVARALGRALAAREVEAERGDAGEADLARRVRSLSLYDGRAGVALLLAALARGGGEPELEAGARAARARLLAGVAALATAHGLPLGGFQGVGSWIWSLVWLDQLGGDREASGLALQLAAGLDEERLAADHRLDVEGGLAGLIVALLALHESAGDARALARARQAGDRLLERSEEAHGGLAWRGEIGRPLAGFAHGASGCARALAALARASGDERYAQAAAGAFRFERALFDPRRRNWPVVLASGTLGEPRATWMTAWCHGAAGVGLARLLAGDPGTDPGLDAELETALATTAGAGLRGDDHLCCGSAGRAAILHLAGRCRRRADWLAAASTIASELVERAVADGDFRLPRGAAGGHESDWGLMRGRTGIAWLAADLAGLDLPSPLALELPSERTARHREGR